jgi:sugar (pentulose or hexulose) kinase
MHAIEKPESDKLLMNATVVQKELIAHSGFDHGYILLNQNGPELVPMVTYLQKQGTPKIGGAVIPIQNQQGTPSIIFNPYLLQKGRKHLLSTSPLINQQLVAYAQQKKETSAEEKKDEQ